uniref:Calponin-homology (CH) domain-containing protein n=1 Tax=Pavo cristatus TaxID=9049 RepID=A0A8C9F0Q7_PAVCR
FAIIHFKSIFPRSVVDFLNKNEQELVQKRTFTKWINTHLAKRNPPMMVSDLFEDIKDGVMLIALLEVLSGQKLVRKIMTGALKFLEGRRVITIFNFIFVRQVGIEIKDFGQSWRSGVAFHSIIHAIRPDLVDMEKVKGRSNRENLEEAFTLAETELGIPRLLDPEDVNVDKPDEKSIMTYVAQFLKYYPDPHHTVADVQENDVSFSCILYKSKEDKLMLRDLKVWAEQFERDLARAQVAETSLQEKYQSFKHFRIQYEMKRKPIELVTQSLRKDGKLSLDQAIVKQAWDRVSSRLFDWHIHLDKSLPAPLGTIGAWLFRAETALREEVSIQQAHEETANIIHRKLEQLKDLLKNIEGHKKTFHEIHRARSVNGVPVPPDQLEDMAERLDKCSITLTSTGIIMNVNNQCLSCILVEEVESVMKFMSETTAQWRNLSVEVRSVRSMLEEVIANWDRYSSTVAGLQAWLEDAEKMLNQTEQSKKDFFRHLPHWIQQHTAMNDAGNFLIETCDETISRDLKQQLLLLNGRWRELFMQVKQKALSLIERNSQSILQCVASSEVLQHFHQSTFQKKVTQVQITFQVITLRFGAYF